MLPNLGPMELIVIMAIALVVFGPKKLPEIGKGLGKAMREFNKARTDFMDSINSETDRDDPPVRSTSSAVHDSYPAERKLEYPEPLDADTADALPYGSEFQAVEGDSQPSFRTTTPDPAPALAAATTDTDRDRRPAPEAAGVGEGKA